MSVAETVPELRRRTDEDLIRPHLKPGENILWATRPSMLGLVPIITSTLLAATGMLLPPLIGRGDAPTIALFASTGFLFAFAGLLAEFVRRYVTLRYTVFAITKDRFYSITSFFSTTVKTIPLSRVTSVTLRQGPIAKLFHLWTARISAYGEAGTRLDIPAIPDGQRLLQEASDGQRRGANAAWILRGD